MKSIYIIIGCICFSISLSAKEYYLSPLGNDSNTGSVESPFYSLSKIVSQLSAGDVVHVKGGTYNYSQTISVIANDPAKKNANSGTEGNRISVIAYDGRAVFDFTQQGGGLMAPSRSDSDRGILHDADYWYYFGIDIVNAKDNGMKLEGNHNIIEFCTFSYNWDSGLQIGSPSRKGDSNDGTVAGYNFIINCDAFFNIDTHNQGKNADGFAPKAFVGPNNYFYGCRSWCNSDDGWDMYQNEYPTMLESCWCFHNGDIDKYKNTPYGDRTPPKGWGGNGNGIKLGGNSTYGSRNIAYRCVVADHHYVKGTGKGFDQNDNKYHQMVLNCLSFDNWKNYALNNSISEQHVIKNNVSLLVSSFSNLDKQIAFNGNEIIENNNWNLGLLYDSKNVKQVVNASNDYESLDIWNDALASREADGSLPDNGFAKLKPASVFLDRGQILSIPFSGKDYVSQYTGTAPDLGPYEYDPEQKLDYSIINKADGTTYNLKAPTGIISPNWETNTEKLSYQISSDFITFFFNLSQTGRIDLSLYNISGEKVRTFVRQSYPKGKNFCTDEIISLPKGAYICVLSHATGKESIKIVKS